MKMTQLILRILWYTRYFVRVWKWKTNVDHSGLEKPSTMLIKSVKSISIEINIPLLFKAFLYFLRQAYVKCQRTFEMYQIGKLKNLIAYPSFNYAYAYYILIHVKCLFPFRSLRIMWLTMRLALRYGILYTYYRLSYCKIQHLP